jgi:lipoyl(octanoyl) transferase
MTDATSIEVQDWGIIDYSVALARQRARLADLVAGRVADTLIVCQHAPVITCGTSSQESSLISSQEALEKEKITVFEVERGGDVTYHGPGQLIAYPMLNLHHFKTDVGWYMRTLEQSIINTLDNFSVTGQRIEGKAGVWISPTRKIASIGVKLSRWCSMHGIAINVLNDSTSGFKHILPCGIAGISTTSVERERGSTPILADFQKLFIDNFLKLFSYSKVIDETTN